MTARRARASAAAVLALGACLGAGGFGAESAAPPLAAARRWACFYGAALSHEAWRSLDLVILDPDRFSIDSGSSPFRDAGGPVRLAYVSAGEANESRSAWSAIKDKPFVLEANPDWAGARRVDMRADEWRSLLAEQVVPAALAKGYQGVFLDTLDVAQYLESKDPARFSGSQKAAADLVRMLRKLHPEMRILINNALPLLPDVGEAVDGVVVEDLYTRCGLKGPCGPTPADVSRSKEAELRNFKAKTGKPVFVILYSPLKERDAPWIRAALRKCRKNGFLPYLSSPALDRLGGVAPGGGG